MISMKLIHSLLIHLQAFIKTKNIFPTYIDLRITRWENSPKEMNTVHCRID